MRARSLALCAVVLAAWAGMTPAPAAATDPDLTTLRPWTGVSLVKTLDQTNVLASVAVSLPSVLLEVKLGAPLEGDVALANQSVRPIKTAFLTDLAISYDSRARDVYAKVNAPLDVAQDQLYFTVGLGVTASFDRVNASQTDANGVRTRKRFDDYLLDIGLRGRLHLDSHGQFLLFLSTGTRINHDVSFRQGGACDGIGGLGGLGGLGGQSGCSDELSLIAPTPDGDTPRMVNGFVRLGLSYTLPHRFFTGGGQPSAPSTSATPDGTPAGDLAPPTPSQGSDGGMRAGVDLRFGFEDLSHKNDTGRFELTPLLFFAPVDSPLMLHFGVGTKLSFALDDGLVSDQTSYGAGQMIDLYPFAVVSGLIGSLL
jgi:hypothetical protein